MFGPNSIFLLFQGFLQFIVFFLVPGYFCLILGIYIYNYIKTNNFKLGAYNKGVIKRVGYVLFVLFGIYFFVNFLRYLVYEIAGPFDIMLSDLQTTVFSFSSLFFMYFSWLIVLHFVVEAVGREKYTKSDFYNKLKKTINGIFGRFFLIIFIIRFFVFSRFIGFGVGFYNPCLGPNPGISCIGIENEGILKCQESDDYKELQSIYGEKNTWIKGYRVQDEELYTWLESVDEGFYGQPGCLIVMNGMGDGKIIQLELENLEPIYEMDLEEFITQARETDKAMLDDFLSRLETSEEIEERVRKMREGK